MRTLIFTCLLAFTFQNSNHSTGVAKTKHDNFDNPKDEIRTQGYFIDKRDQHKYKVVKIGKQTWMAENLDFKISENALKLKSGDFYVDMIVTQKGQLIKDDFEGKGCGRLYNWNDAMNACPAGWHIPSIEEWHELESFLGINHEDLLKNHERKSTVSVRNKLCIDQISGFNAFPCGSFYIEEKLAIPNNRAIIDVYNFFNIWLSTQAGELIGREAAYIVQFSKNKNSLIDIIKARKENGCSVRCIKDN